MNRRAMKPRNRRGSFRPALEHLEVRVVPAPTVFDPNLEVRPAVTGLSQPVAMAFLGNDDFFVTEKASGRVKRVDHGVVTTVLDLPVNSNSERGLLGIALHPDFPANPGVYLYWTESTATDAAGNPIDSAAINDVPLLGNRVDRFVWDGSSLTFGQEIIQLRAWQPPNPPNEPGQFGNHDGGVIRFGPDGMLYIFIGDVGRRGNTQNIQMGFGSQPGQDDQFGGPMADNAHLTGVTLRLYDNGFAPEDNPFFGAGFDIGQTNPEVGGNVQKIFSYGHRNSFGLAFDPVTGNLWNEENGDDTFTELNLVEPGMNGGWVQVAGPISRVSEFRAIERGTAPGFPANTFRGLQQARYSPDNIATSPAEALSRLFMLPGAHYSDPEFSWKFEVAPAAIGFMNGSGLGAEYDGNLFVGAARPFLAGGPLFRFFLNADRTGFDFDDPRLADKVADNANKFDPRESETLLFGVNFGVGTDIQTGPNGNLYVVSNTDNAVYEIRKRPTPVTGFTAFLTGDQEVPPRITDARAIAMFELNAAQTELKVFAQAFRLDFGMHRSPGAPQLTPNPLDNVSGLHIHSPGPVGVNAAVVWGIIGPQNDLDDRVIVASNIAGGGAGGPIITQATIQAAWDGVEGNAGATLANHLENLVAENTYLNIHTTLFPGGETRGQIQPKVELMTADSIGSGTSETLAADQVTPLLAEALARAQAAGMDISGLGSFDIRIADLAGATLGMVTGNTIWLDINAAGWGWFIDPTPGDDSEFTTPGDQGEQDRMDLLTVLAHELGHLLGQEHEADGLMAETLSAGIRLAPGVTGSILDAAVVEWLLAKKK